MTVSWYGVRGPPLPRRGILDQIARDSGEGVLDAALLIRRRMEWVLTNPP